jgi:SIR2-like domain
MDYHDTAVTWVIGAGMSVGAGIPAMAGLTRLLFSERYMMGRRNELAHFCGFAFPGVDLHLDMDGAVTAGSAFSVNIEELMTTIDAFGATIQRTKLGIPLLDYRMLRAQLAHIVGECINELSVGALLPEYYRRFALLLKPGDVVVTLNWDTLLERAMTAYGVRWALASFSLRGGDLKWSLAPDRVHLVKLHGSVDWRIAGSDDRDSEPLFSVEGEPQIVRSSRVLKDTQYVGDSLWTLPEMPYLVPPSHFKSASQRGLDGALWACAYGAILHCRELRIIGYSLPVTDYEARWLLRTGVMFNPATGIDYVKRFWRGRTDIDIEDELQGMPIETHVRELQAQALMGGNQEYQAIWNRSAIPVTVVNPDILAEERFRTLVSDHLEFRRQTADEYFSDQTV